MVLKLTLIEGGIKCVGCECGNSLDFQSNAGTCDDCEKQFSKYGEKIQYLEEEWNLPRAVDHSSVS